VSNRPEDTFFGDAWPAFIGDCRFTLASESGSSIHDPEGALRDAIDAHVREHPDATYDEIAAACLGGVAEQAFCATSPRIFEAALLETCQVLVAGSYASLRPGEHYIELAPDLSNIEEVLGAMRDLPASAERARAARAAVAEDRSLRYSEFAARLERLARAVGVEERGWPEVRDRAGRAPGGRHVALAVENLAHQAEAYSERLAEKDARISDLETRLGRLQDRFTQLEAELLNPLVFKLTHLTGVAHFTRRVMAHRLRALLGRRRR
jgi:hypothetical protein